jgi:RNA polymerase sigma factor for flagellar operon FliA
MAPADTAPLVPNGPPPALLPEGEGALWTSFRATGDPALRQQLIAHYIDYARIVAASYYARRNHNEIEFAEYHQLASLALIESIDRYDPDKGAQFKTFASRRMHGAILDGLERLTEKQQQIAVRQRLRQERLQSIKDQARDDKSTAPERGSKAHADELFRYLAEVGIGIALGCLLDGTGMLDKEDDSAAVPLAYQRLEFRQLQNQLRDLVRHLPPQARTVITSHYLHEQSFEDIAARLELTKSRISQIHRQALQSLRTQLQSGRGVDVAW